MSSRRDPRGARRGPRLQHRAQLQMFAALGAAPPRFAHEALLVGSEGKLSKRLGSLGCDAFPRARGSSLKRSSRCSRGSVLRSRSSRSPIEAGLVVESFDLAHFGRAPARFDPHEVELVNARLLHKLDYAAVADRLPAGATEAGLAAAPAQPRAAVRFRRLVRGASRRDRRRPSSATTSGCSRARTAAAVAEQLDWGAEPWRALAECAQGRDRQEGPRAVPSAAGWR